MKLKRKIMLFEEFEQAVQTTSTKVDVNIHNKGSEIRTEIVNDVDNIINSLELLSTQIKEDLDFTNIIPLTEGDGAIDKAIDFMLRGPRAKKAQAKVNKLALKVADLDSAKDQLPRGEKSQLQDKIDKLKQGRDDLQKNVDDKISKESNIVKRMQSTEKIKGKMEVLKAGMGEGSSGDVKDQMKTLQNRLKDEQEAIKGDEPSSEEKDKAKEQIEKAKEAKEKEKEDDGTVEPVEPKVKNTELDDATAKLKAASDAKAALKDDATDEEKAAAEKAEKDAEAALTKAKEVKESIRNPNKPKLYEGMSIADRFKILM